MPKLLHPEIPPTLSDRIAALENKLDKIPSMSVEDLRGLVEAADRLSPELMAVIEAATSHADCLAFDSLSQRLHLVVYAADRELMDRCLTVSKALSVSLRVCREAQRVRGTPYPS